MSLPKCVKCCGIYHGRMTDKAYRSSQVVYGSFDPQALEPAWVILNQIEVARIVITRYTKRLGKVWTKVFPDRPVIRKPAETRMSSGKGAPEYWVVAVKFGRVTFKIGGATEAAAKEAVHPTVNKLPIKCKFAKKEEMGGEQS